MSHFKLIGPSVEFGDVAIDYEHADSFRQHAMMGTKIRRLEVNETHTLIDTTSYASGVLSDAAADYSVDERAYFGKTVYGQDPDFWRSSVTFARYNQKNADTKIYNIFEVEAIGSEPVHAVRRVHIIRHLSRLSIEDDEPFEECYSRQYKKFERPMTHEDVAQVNTSIKRIIARQAIMTARNN